MPENRPARWNICIIRLCYANYIRCIIPVILYYINYKFSKSV